MPFVSPVAQRRIEAAAMLAAALVAYGQLGFAWSTFALCFFLPDLSIAFYLAGPRLGGLAYNAAHCFAWPILLGAFWLLSDAPVALQAALVWSAHVAFDRALGWGLKYEQSFVHTDMGEKSLPVSVSFLEPAPSE